MTTTPPLAPPSDPASATSDPQSGPASAGFSPPAILWTGVLLGLLGDQIIWTDQRFLTSGFALWVLALGIAMMWHVQQRSQTLLKVLLPWVALAATLSVLLVWRSSGALIPGVWLSLALCTGFILLFVQHGQRRMPGLLDLASLQIQVARHLLSGWYQVLKDNRQNPSMAPDTLRARIRGVLLTLPLLVVFITLFGQADAVFSNFIGSVLGNISDQWWRHVGFSTICILFSLGLLHLSTTPHAVVMRGPRYTPLLGFEELRIILVTLCVLFVGFGALQLSYLFGGRELILASRITVAAYARRGFYELLVAVILTLGILLLLHSVAVRSRLFAWGGGILVACLLILLLSAIQRMVLYVDSYGLSMDRLTALAIIGWLGLCLLLFVSTVLRNRPQGFAFGAALRFMIMVGMFALINPAGLITRVNLDRHLRAHDPLDLAYLLALGPDATTVLLQHYPALNQEQQCLMALNLKDSLYEETTKGSWKTRWLGWQASTAAEQQAFAVHASALRIWRMQAKRLQGPVNITGNENIPARLHAISESVPDEAMRRCAVLSRIPAAQRLSLLPADTDTLNIIPEQQAR